MNIVPKRKDQLIYWIQEREKIRIAREAGLPKRKWSLDPTMLMWRWCNVDRNDDRVTRWIHKNIIKAHPRSKSLWFNLAIARFINLPSTLRRIGYMDEWDPDRFCSTIAKCMEAGVKTYTGAYMIRAGTGADAAVPKHEYLAARVFGPLWEKRKEAAAIVRQVPMCQLWNKFFAQIFGMGDFMRNQIVTDMKYTRYLDPEMTDDWETFCLAGPGTTRGLCRLYGRPLSTKLVGAYELLLDTRILLMEIQPLPKEKMRCFLDLNNVANCLCEFDKYVRYVTGEGRPRTRYTLDPTPMP